MMHSSLLRASLIAMAWACAGAVQAVPVSVAFDNFTYSGTVTRYATLADAQNQTNPVGGPYPILTGFENSSETRPNARDGQIAVVSEAPLEYGTDLTYMSTAWYFTTNIANGNGWGNPNETNDGFIQYYLESSPTIGGGWQPGHTQFRLSVAGGDGDDADAGRFWPAPDRGAPEISYGKFIEFNLDVIANFASPATLNNITGWYETMSMPSSFSGTLRGIFENDQTDTPSYNGFYRFNYTVTGPGSWADDNNAVWEDQDGTIYPPQSIWAAPEAVTITPAIVPGPGKLALFGLAFALALVAALRLGVSIR